MTTTNYSYNSAAGVTVEDTLVQDRLFDRNTHTRVVTIAQSGPRTRGELLGKIKDGAVTAAVKAGGNTGNGTFVVDPATPLLANAEPGVYSVRFTSATNARLESTTGTVLGDIPIVATTGQTAAVAERIKGLITQGSTVFVAGDGFDITVATAATKYALATAASVNGSQVPDVVLLESVDATAGDVQAAVAISGEFATQGIIFGAGLTAASVDDVLRTKDIYLQNIIG